MQRKKKPLNLTNKTENLVFCNFTLNFISTILYDDYYYTWVIILASFILVVIFMSLFLLIQIKGE